LAEKAIDDGLTDVAPHKAFVHIEYDPVTLIPSFKVDATALPPPVPGGAATRSGPLAYDGLAALTAAPEHEVSDGASSTTSSPLFTRPGPLVHGGLDVTASG
jgi:hypothetical protein